MERNWDLVVEDVGIVVVAVGVLGAPLWGLIWMAVEALSN